jgi:hypothetical protein
MLADSCFILQHYSATWVTIVDGAMILNMIIYIFIYLFNCNWVDTRWQKYSTHLHTNNTKNTENGTYITIKKLNTQQ